MKRPVPLALLSAVLVAGAAHAHQYWLTVSDHAPQPGETVVIGACSGTGFRGEARPWAADRCVDFSYTTFRRFALTPYTGEGDIVWGEQAAMDTLGTWVQYQSNFASIELPAAEFDDYLAQEGLDGPRAARGQLAQPTAGRERYRRCCKAWLRGFDTRRAIQPLGQPLELVPRSLPGAGPTLRVRVLWRGAPLANALVKTWCQPFGADGAMRPATERDSVAVAEAVRSDARGEVSLDVHAAGEWLVSTVRMIPVVDAAKTAPGTPAADWESTWASLTFARLASDTTRRSTP